MKSIFKKICLLSLAVLLIGLGIFAIINLTKNKSSEASVISSSFVGYDFARAVTGDADKVSMLLDPGAEAHDFEPTPDDIIAIKNADLFIYIGGESDEWVEDLLSDNEIPEEKTLRLMDYVAVKEEELSEGMEEESASEEPAAEESEEEADEEAEYDEHIWTSPKNAIKLVRAISDKLSEINPDQKDLYEKNSAAYINEIAALDQAFSSVVQNANRKELIFADRFPFRYFVDDYGLTYYAAFPGCSDQTEASSNTIAFLIDKVKDDNIKTILKIELTSDKLAQTIAEETGANILEFNAAHNISKSDFESGRTYVDIMKDNVKVLEEALK